MNDYINYYDLLDIKKDATSDEIKSAYRNLAKKWHPDLNKDQKAPEMARKINEAKEILLDEEKRKEYDLYLDNYKSGIYDNLNKKQNYQSYNNNYEEKTYTKWEYFIFYLKYYNVNIFRKIIGSIFVLLESLLCFLLQFINYIVAFIIIYFGFYLIYGFAILAGLLTLLIVLKFAARINIYPYTPFDYALVMIGIIVSIALSILMQDLPYLLLNKIPVLISKLNMFLFKMSIGYKK